jgi:hypothetical protein
MDTTTDTIRDPQANVSVHFRDFALSSSNQFSTTMRLSGVPVASGRIIKEPPIVWRHSILRIQLVGGESRGRKECCGATQRECRISLYHDRHQIPGAVAVEQLSPAMGPERFRSAVRRDRPLCGARVWEWYDVNLKLTGLIRGVCQPAAVNDRSPLELRTSCEHDMGCGGSRHMSGALIAQSREIEAV